MSNSLFPLKAHFKMNDAIGSSFEAQIIDTPGIKGFGVVDMEPAEIDNYFP